MGTWKFNFDDARQLAHWTVKGDVAVDAARVSLSAALSRDDAMLASLQSLGSFL